MTNKYPRSLTGSINPISALWRRRKEQGRNVDGIMKMCANKKSYANQHDSENAGGVIKYGQRVYKCPHCGFWHATSKDKME